MNQNIGYYNFIYSQKALSSKELRRIIDLNLDLYDSEYVILQIGIVDCARRVFSEKAVRFINMLPIFRNVIKYLANKYHLRLTKLYKITYTSPGRFADNIKYFIERFRNSKQIIIIPILPAGSKQKKKSYKIQEQIDLYNSIFINIAQNYQNVEFLAGCIDKFLPIDDSLYTSDGYHISKRGHALILNELILRFKSNLI